MSHVADGSSSHSTVKKIKYDVFISFRGEDTRSNITSLIHSALCREKIKAFIDEEDLKKGNEISPTLLKAIEKSKLCLVILSEDYASSRWCLDELVHILQCKKTEGQVIPVFYKVDPSDVRKQQKSYAGAFAKLRTQFDDMKLQEWRQALDKIGNLSGWTSKESGTESQLIDSIVDDVKNKLNAMSVAGSKLRGLVGIVERIKEVEQLLQIGSLNKLGPIAERQRDLVAYLNQLEMKKKKKKKKKMMMMIMTITVVESLNQMIKKKITVNHSLRDLEHENHFSS